MHRFKFIYFTVFITVGLLIGVMTQFPDNKLHIVFCTVGQGDSIYIKTPQGSDVLIDGGPGDGVLGCLGRHMPFYDRTIDVVVMTHPQADHMQGLLKVIDRYSIYHFVTSPVGHTTKGFAQLKQLIEDKGIPVKNPYTGTAMDVGGVNFTTLWPEQQWLIAHQPSAVPSTTLRTSSSQLSDSDSRYTTYDILNTNILGAFTSTTDLNDFSVYLHLRYGEFDALFTGDGDMRIQDDIARAVVLPDVEVLKVPHHGSKTGMSEEFLDQVKPELAVISVGANNKYGHPGANILEMLQTRGISLRRTDESGPHGEASDVEVVSDGKEWWIK